MRQISNYTQPNSKDSICEQDKFAEGLDSAHERLVIQQANKHVKLIDTLREYSIIVEKEHQFTEWCSGIVCPFPFHKAGKERTGSFGYNFNTDRFHCFGCGKSGQTVEFISFKEGIPRLIIAERLVRERIGYLPNNVVVEEDIDPQIDRLLFDFSKYINAKLLSDPLSVEDIDKVTWWIDDYIISVVPQRKVVVEELSARLSKAKEVLGE